MSQHQVVFAHTEFGQVEIIRIDGKEWFSATQVAKALGYSNPWKAISAHCRKDGLTKREVIDALGRKQETNFINEGNLYRLIIKSHLPSAERFETWVFDEVLPSIRKTGRYSLPSAGEIAASHPARLLLNGPTWGQRFSETEKMRETMMTFIPADEVARRCGIYTASRYAAKPYGKFINHLVMAQLIEIEEDELVFHPMSYLESVVPKVAEWMSARQYPTEITFGNTVHRIQFFIPRTDRGYYLAGE
ncbi:Bro-N domain-containing protein [Brevibacillus porteri]|uniref:Bro-N domain-containing protein n=1 Tax=Brevibacillus porteri TaxID=2126350 RepID=A0ABX5FFM1_9BACL|nr:BRO family protein [Brevibacillus porteri]MED1801802.1 BRO family protein [Brevibacillus porteri]MED2134933.1 BRO family protein [Brevibacillus porteri]MED2748440.1 BRO family protein [Brevibacillus porteri]MED2818364.1 BRO family protein [Brevibacillus porteri]MED2897677.1 BRO family protein [Brevibacillus porteri]